MHEYPVTLEIVRMAEKTAREKGGIVKAIHLVVGEDSGFIGESIQMYFDVISEGTLCEGAPPHHSGCEAQNEMRPLRLSL